MIRSFSHLHPMLIQVRESDAVARHEAACFIDRCDFSPKRMRTHNVVTDPDIRFRDVADADVVLIGGAAAHSVTQAHEFDAPLRDVVLRMIDEDRPLFGSCWGHQFMARVLGGEVITDAASSEVGSFEIFVSPGGHDDPLLAGLPDRFMAHMGHHDSISRLPDSCIELAHSARCRNQVFRIKDKPAYGTQFHTEMSAQRLIERLEMYRDSYIPSDDEFEALKQRPLPTPEADTILHRFLEQYV